MNYSNGIYLDLPPLNMLSARVKKKNMFVDFRPFLIIKCTSIEVFLDHNFLSCGNVMCLFIFPFV